MHPLLWGIIGLVYALGLAYSTIAGLGILALGHGSDGKDLAYIAVAVLLWPLVVLTLLVFAGLEKIGLLGPPDV